MLDACFVVVRFRLLDCWCGSVVCFVEQRLRVATGLGVLGGCRVVISYASCFVLRVITWVSRWVEVFCVVMGF